MGVPTLDSGGKLAVTISISAKHALPLEFGTSRMAARPFARPALTNMRDQVVNAVAAELRAGNLGVTGSSVR
jgi:HK97 gp10 family phage protein